MARIDNVGWWRSEHGRREGKGVGGGGWMDEWNDEGWHCQFDGGGENNGHWGGEWHWHIIMGDDDIVIRNKVFCWSMMIILH